MLKLLANSAAVTASAAAATAAQFNNMLKFICNNKIN
jgi:hypothetical protein